MLKEVCFFDLPVKVPEKKLKNPRPECRKGPFADNYYYVK
jgi:hypothetical protein